MITKLHEGFSISCFWTTLFAIEIPLLINNLDGLVQDYNISIAHALEILQTCNEPSICSLCEAAYWHVWLQQLFNNDIVAKLYWCVT